jgi:hypothetical protein
LKWWEEAHWAESALLVLKVEADKADDCFDGFRYGVYSYIGAAEKPREMVIQEALTSDDPTMRNLQRMMAEEKYAKMNANSPIYFGRRAYLN